MALALVRTIGSWIWRMTKLRIESSNVLEVLQGLMFRKSIASVLGNIYPAKHMGKSTVHKLGGFPFGDWFSYFYVRQLF